MPSVLLVHPDPALWLDALPEGADVTTAETAQSARAYLAGTAFDAVYVGPGVEGGEAIAALRDVLGLSTPVERVASAEALAARLAPPAGGGDATLREIRDELGRVAHALNNPLAVIAGNAQLAAELARAVPTDPTITESLSAIVEASAALEDLFGDVAALRQRVDRALREGGS